MEATLNGPSGRTMLGSTAVTLGRAPDNTIVVNDPKASSHHAEIRPEGQYYNLVDLGSTNGTFVNDQQVYSGVPRLLQPGDTLRIGDTKFTFEANTSQSASYSDGSTVRATPPVNASPGFAGNTSYGMGNPGYPGGQPYQEAGAAPPPPPSSQQPSYTPPQLSETQMPTYIPSSYGQSDQQPSYTPPQPGYMQQPGYSTQQEPSYTPPAPVYNPPPEQKQKRSPARAIILVVVALVIILAGVIGYFVVHNNQVAQNNSNATATANTTHNNATATAQVQAQATAQAAATATAVVTSHYPPFTSLAFNDPLTSSSDSQWSSGSACKASTTGYQVSIAQVGHFEFCTQLNSNYSDFALQVNMTIQSGDCGGLIFREQDINNYYIMAVCADGSYDAGLFQNGKAFWADDLTQRPTSPAIKKGPGQQNVVAIVVQGNAFNLYVNGSSKTVDTFTDNGSTFSSGSIALVALDMQNPTSVVYTNAVVWTQ